MDYACQYIGTNNFFLIAVGRGKVHVIIDKSSGNYEDLRVIEGQPLKNIDANKRFTETDIPSTYC